jgi:O-antigen ligase
MKFNITKNYLTETALILSLIANTIVSGISNTTSTAFALKIISSSVLLIVLYFNLFTYHIPVIEFLKSKQLHRILAVLLFIIAYLALTLLYSSNPLYGLNKILNILISVTPNVIVAYFLLYRCNANTVNKIITISSISIISLLMLVLWLQPFDQSTIYQFSPGRWSHVVIGRLVSFLTLILLLFALSQIEYKKIITYSIIYGAGVYLTYLTGLRSAFLGLILFSIIIIILKFIYLLRIKTSNHTLPLLGYYPAIFSIITLAIVFILILFAPSGFQSGKRFENLAKIEKLDFGDDGAIHARLDSYELSINIIKEHPLLGIGFGGFNGYNNIEWTRIVKYSHNIILEILSELGIFGFAVFLIMLIKITMGILKVQFSIDKAKYQSLTLNYSFLILFLFTLWLAMFSKDISTQGFLWLFLAAYGAKSKALNV